MRNLLNQLELSNEAVLVREHAREAAYGKVQAPWFIRLPFAVLCWTLDVVFNNRPIQRCAPGLRPGTFSALSCSADATHRYGRPVGDRTLSALPQVCDAPSLTGMVLTSGCPHG